MSERAISHPGTPLGLEIFHAVGEPVVAVGHLLERISCHRVPQRIRGGVQLVGFEAQAFYLAQNVTHGSPD